jgi:hypothetical protein
LSEGDKFDFFNSKIGITIPTPTGVEAGDLFYTPIFKNQTANGKPSENFAKKFADIYTFTIKAEDYTDKNNVKAIPLDGYKYNFIL